MHVATEEQALNHKRKLYASYKRLLKREGLEEKTEGDAVSDEEGVDQQEAPVSD
jgi:hypothetical protein